MGMSGSMANRAGKMKKFSIQSDGKTVWVHGIQGTVGRFGPRGIDIHSSDTSKCLLCTHGPTEAQEWNVFVEKMREIYGVEIADEHKPGWLK